jgi:hypothetical protein
MGADDEVQKLYIERKRLQLGTVAEADRRRGTESIDRGTAIAESRVSD